jgi:hypothetical protein
MLTAPGEVTRRTIDLSGAWEFQRDGSTNFWKSVPVPSTFQVYEGTNFHGMGWLRKTILAPNLPSGYRALLQFQAAATEAEVWCDQQRLGSHLGGWTPFRFDITSLIRAAASGAPLEIKVRLDEKVGHNTQGFLPIIAPHFGGLWQPVELLIVPEIAIDDLQLLAVGDPASRELRLEIPILHDDKRCITQALVEIRRREESQWAALTPHFERIGSVLKGRARFPEAERWEPEHPAVYEVRISLPTSPGDQVLTRASFRSIEAFGSQFRLNGRPLMIRGLLNWGYSPPHFAPNPGEAAWRSEFGVARARGFNLMKFCLWIPPKRCLELADELGMLTWMEYPTWHPNLTEKYLPHLREEFREFFYYDRNHPSVILRSLTCETGPSAQLPVIQSLYDLAHELVPGALVEDDSSWIGWNRIHDFYDDHPYGNNHTWVKALHGFDEHIRAHGLKPLVLGEAIAADTWIDRSALLERLGTNRPWWGPGPLDAVERWSARLSPQCGDAALALLGSDSLHYALLMRKFQIEAFRRETPYSGYVVSVIRDIPTASMGLIDYLDRPKWSPAEWSWHGDTMLLLQTPGDRRSFYGDANLHGEILLSHFGRESLSGGTLAITLTQEANNGVGAPRVLLSRHVKEKIAQAPGTLTRLADLDFSLPAAEQPFKVVLAAALTTAHGSWRNEWPLWVVPKPAPFEGPIVFHRSASNETIRALFAGSAPSLSPSSSNSATVIVASRFDMDLVRALESGGRVLFIPNGEKFSFRTSDHWFLRGAPVVPGSTLAKKVPHDLWVELQHFDLAGPIVPNLPYLEDFDPLLLLWDTHDQAAVRTHGLVFETRIGSGRLLVTSLGHRAEAGAAGPWLLRVFIDRLLQSQPPESGISPAVWDYLKASLQAEQTNLVERTWQFRPDPNNEGLAQGWQQRRLDSTRGWKDLRIGAWWESQGYPALDGWAWYRLEVDVPPPWLRKQVYLSFEGVDDVYELYVNGQFAGKGGDLATRRDALAEKKSHDLTSMVQPGTNTIAVRVHDWYGAGGIFRPVTLGTLPLNPDLDLLR